MSTDPVEAPIVHGTISVSELFVGNINGAAYDGSGGGGGGGGVSSADLAAYFDTTKPFIAGGDFDPDGTPEARIMYVGETFDPYNYHRRMYDDISAGYVIDGKASIKAFDMSTDTTTPVEIADTTVRVYTTGTADPDDSGANPELDLDGMFTHLNSAANTAELTIPDGELWLVSEDNAAYQSAVEQNSPGLLAQYTWLQADNGTDAKLGGFGERFDTPCTMFFRFTPSETTSHYGPMFSSQLTGSLSEWIWTEASMEFGHSEDALYFSVLEQPSSNNTNHGDMHKNQLLVKKHTGMLLKGYTYEAFVSWPDVTDRSLWPASRGGTVQMASQPSGEQITIGWRVAELPGGTALSQSEWNVGPGVFGVDSLTGSGDGSSAHVHATGFPCVQSTDPLSTYVIQNTLSAQFKYDGTPTTGNVFQGYMWPEGTQHRIFQLNGQVNLLPGAVASQNKGPLLIRLYNTDITDPAVFSAPKLTPTSSLKLGTHYIRHIATDKYGNQTDNQSEFYRQVEVLTDSASTPVFSTDAAAVFDETTAGNAGQGGHDVLQDASTPWILSSTQDWTFSAQFNIPETGTETDTRADPVGLYSKRTAVYIGNVPDSGSLNDDGLFTGQSYIMFQTRYEDHWLNDTGVPESRDVVRIIINDSSANTERTFLMDLQSEVQEHKFMEIMLSYRAGGTVLFDTSAPGQGIGDGLSVFMRSAIDSSSSLPTAWRKIELSDTARPTYYNRIVTPVAAVPQGVLDTIAETSYAGLISSTTVSAPNSYSSLDLNSAFSMYIVQDPTATETLYRLLLNDNNSDYSLHEGFMFSVTPGTYTITVDQSGTGANPYYIALGTWPNWAEPVGLSLESSEVLGTYRPNTPGDQMAVYKGTVTMTVTEAFEDQTARFYVYSGDSFINAINDRFDGTNDFYLGGSKVVGIASANGDVRNLQFYQKFMTPNMLDSNNYLKNVDLGVQQSVLTTQYVNYVPPP